LGLRENPNAIAGIDDVEVVGAVESVTPGTISATPTVFVDP